MQHQWHNKNKWRKTSEQEINGKGREIKEWIHLWIIATCNIAYYAWKYVIYRVDRIWNMTNAFLFGDVNIVMVILLLYYRIFSSRYRYELYHIVCHAIASDLWSLNATIFLNIFFCKPQWHTDRWQKKCLKFVNFASS